MKHTILKMIASPDDVKKLSSEECKQLCEELRAFLLDSVSETGGHLASNLGAVELTVAIHRVFDTAKDRLVFDVGHQCYVHKALTGRQALFSMLRSFGGMSGFPKPHESVHDAFVAGHASNSVSVALGMARARTLQGADYRVLALIGDGALTGGLAYEGLNNAGALAGTADYLAERQWHVHRAERGRRGFAFGAHTHTARILSVQKMLSQHDAPSSRWQGRVSRRPQGKNQCQKSAVALQLF